MPTPFMSSRSQTDTSVRGILIAFPFQFDSSAVIKLSAVAAAPVVEPVQNIEVPTIEIPAAPAIEPAVTPVVDTPVAAPVAPIEPVVAPVENVATPAPAVEAPVVAPAAPVSDKYTVVTNMYPSSLEVKTGNEPHFVVPVADNSKLTKKDEKTLIMNKTA